MRDRQYSLRKCYETGLLRQYRAPARTSPSPCSPESVLATAIYPCRWRGHLPNFAGANTLSSSRPNPIWNGSRPGHRTRPHTSGPQLVGRPGHREPRGRQSDRTARRRLDPVHGPSGHRFTLITHRRPPTVLINISSPFAGHSALGPAARDGAQSGVEHLLGEHGHRNVALIIGESTEVVPEPRERGFADAFRALDLPPGPVVRTAFSRQGGYEAMQQILQWPTPAGRDLRRRRPAGCRRPPGDSRGRGAVPRRHGGRPTTEPSRPATPGRR